MHALPYSLMISGKTWPVKVKKKTWQVDGNSSVLSRPLMTWQYWRAGVDKQIEKCVAVVLMRVMSRWSAVLTNNRTDWRDRWCWCDWWDEVTVSFNCKSKLALILSLGYLKPFLAGSKKTRQGLGWRVCNLCISRCWFYLTVVAGPKLIQKDYKIIWCCVLLCYGSWCLWYVNDEVEDFYEMIMQ